MEAVLEKRNWKYQADRGFSSDELEKILRLPNPDKAILVDYFGLFARNKKSTAQLAEFYAKSKQEISTRIHLSIDRLEVM